MAEMAFLDHLEELRWRLFKCAAALAFGGVVAVALFQLPDFNVIEFLARPITPYLHGQKLIYLHPGDAFQILLDAGFALAAVIASPVILYQLWGFVSPAMYAHEKKMVLPVLGGIVLLFIAGASMAFTLILPMTLRFLINVESTALQPMIAASEYFGFAIYMCLAFGAAFELPIVIMGLTALGLTNPKFLAKYRRYAIVAGLILGGMITPDPTAMFAIAIPMYGLFELSIVLSRMVYKWRERRDTSAGPGSAAPQPAPPTPPAPSPVDDAPRRLGGPA